MHHFYLRLASILFIEKHFFNKTRFQKTLYGFAAWKHCWQDQDPWVSHLHMVMSHWNKVKQQVLILNSADLFISCLICISWLSVVKRPKNIGKNGKRNNFSVFDFKFQTAHSHNWPTSHSKVIKRDVQSLKNIGLRLLPKSFTTEVSKFVTFLK